MFKEKLIKAKDFVIPLFVCFVFFAFATWLNHKVGDRSLLGSMQKMDNDDVRYIRSAWTFLDTGKITYQSPDEKSAFIMPGITITLSFFMSMFGKVNGIMVFRIFQCFAIACSIYLTYLIAYRVFKNRIVAYITLIANAIYIPDYYSTTLVLTESVFKFLFVFTIYYIIVALESKSSLHYVLAALGWSLSMMFRPTTVLLPVVVFIMWLILKYSWKEQLKFALIVGVIALAVMSPWWIRNYIAFHEFIPFTHSSANPIALGSAFNFDYASVDGQVIATKDFSDAFLMKITKTNIKNMYHESPFKLIYWYGVRKPFELIRKPFYWTDVFKIEKTAPVTLIQQGLYLCLALSGLLFYLRRIKRYNKLAVILPLMLIYFYLFHIPYVCFERYGYPIVWVLIILGANMVYKIFSLEPVA